MARKQRTTTITGVIYENEAKFEGAYPEINISETVLDELQDIDGTGKKPMFVTLPVGFINAESRNGRKYNERTAQAILEAINNDKPIGQRGHLPEADRPYRFDVPPLVWVAAEQHGGTIWGKAYVMASAPDVREYIRSAKAVNGKIGTSIYGTAEVDKDGNVSNLTIESIDLGHPNRLGIPQAAATPVISQEMEMADEQEITEQTEPDVEPDQDVTVNEQEQEPAMARNEEQIDEAVRVERLKARITELEKDVRVHKDAFRTMEDLMEKFGVKTNDSVVSEITIMREQLEDMADVNRKLLQEVMDYMIERKVRAENVRPIVRRIVEAKNPQTKHELEMAIDETLREQDVRKLMKGQVIETMGSAVRRPATNDRRDNAWMQFLEPSEGDS